ncbi:MAG: CoA pyrophosphatase [Candidatus Marinimicrobia bacterium]|nr:CoA pyrophosphatase [Candidatus Neomarinimicrobiota bacterium]
MKTISFDILKSLLNRPLPGEKVHWAMWPRGHKDEGEEAVYPASTMVLIYEEKDRLYFPLIRRSDRKDDPHRKQIGLPGGHHEGNESYLETALRETEEEIGVRLFPQEIAGKLSPLTVKRSGFVIHPFVAYTRRKIAFHPDPSEVEEIIPITFEELINHDDNQTFRLENGWEVPGFLFTHVNVWGATAMILNELKYLIADFLASTRDPLLVFPQKNRC